MNTCHHSGYTGLTYFNKSLDIFEKGLNIAGYFSPYPANIRVLYGIAQIVTSLSIGTICELGIIISRTLGHTKLADQFDFVASLTYPYCAHGTANFLRAFFEYDKGCRPIMLLYDLTFDRFSYD